MSVVAYMRTRGVPEEERCPACAGDGDGNGLWTLDEEGIPHPPRCPACDGTGLRQCEPE